MQNAIAIRNSVFADNFSGNGATGTNPGSGGGGLTLQGVPADVAHATFDRNRLGTGTAPQFAGHAILVLEAAGVAASTLNLSYSVVSNHVAGPSNAVAICVKAADAGPENVINFTTGRFSGNLKDTNSDGLPLAVGSINGLGSMTTVLDPLYVSPGSYDYHLRTGSPLVNAAAGSSEALDMDRLPRADAVPDIGADELGFGFQPFIAQLPTGISTARARSGAERPFSWAPGAYRTDEVVDTSP
jgi:hypothetical protein